MIMSTRFGSILQSHSLYFTNLILKWSYHFIILYLQNIFLFYFILRTWKVSNTNVIYTIIILLVAAHIVCCNRNCGQNNILNNASSFFKHHIMFRECDGIASWLSQCCIERYLLARATPLKYSKFFGLHF